MIKTITKHFKIILISLVVFCFAMSLSSKVLAATQSQSNEPSKFSNYTSGKFSSDSEDKIYTIEDVIFNKIPFLDPNIFSDKPGGEDLKEGSINEFMRNTVAEWYVSLRNVVAAVIIILGIYNGIRMAISTVADEKAKYKEMLYSWLKSIVMVLFIHLLIIAILNGNTWIVNRFSKEMTETEEESMYYIIKSRAYDMRFSVGMPAMVMYIIMVYYYFKFLWRYIKRYFKILVLILMAPVISARAAFDSSKGKSFDLAFRDWIYDLFKTVFIQTVHVVEYIIFIRLAYNLIKENAIGFVYAMIMMHFMLESEEIVTNIFNFGDKIDRFQMMRSGFRSDMAKFKAFIGFSTVTNIAKKTYAASASGSSKLSNKLNDFVEEHNNRRRAKKGGKDTLLDKARNTRDSAMSKMYRAGIDHEALAFNRMSNDEVKDFQDLIKNLQQGKVTPQTLNANQRKLLSKAGLDPSKIITRNKLKDLAEARKAERRFSKERMKANAQLGANAVKYGYTGISRNIRGYIRNNKVLNRRYIGHQHELILKDMALGTGSRAKVAKKTLKKFKEARKSAYKSRRQVLYKTVKGGLGAGLGLTAAVPIGVVAPPLGIAVAMMSAKSMKNTANMFTGKNKAEDNYTKAYSAVSAVAEGNTQMDKIMEKLNAIKDPRKKKDAVDAMEKTTKFNINSINLGTMIPKYVNLNKLGEYSEVEIMNGVKEISKDIISNARGDLSSSDRENVERAVEQAMRRMVSKYSTASKDIKEKDITADFAGSMQKSIVDNTVKPEHRGLAYMINDLKDIKQLGKEKYGVKKDTIEDSIKELRKSIKTDNSNDKEDSKGKQSRYADSGDVSKPGGNKKNTSKFGDTSDASKPGDANENASRYGDTEDGTKPEDIAEDVIKPGNTNENASKYGDTEDVVKPGDTKDAVKPGDTKGKTSKYDEIEEETEDEIKTENENIENEENE